MNKCKIATTVEQSHKLITSGVNPMCADMVWRVSKSDEKEEYKLTTPFDYDTFSINDVPAWSSASLGAMLPSAIRVDDITYRIRSYKYGHEYYIEYYKEYQPLSSAYIGCSTEMDKDCEDEIDCKVKLLLELISKHLIDVPVNYA